MARKGYNIDEMRALKLAYDGDVTRNDKLKYWLLPGILSGFLAALVMTPRISFKWLQTVQDTGMPAYVATDFKPPIIPVGTPKEDLAKFVVKSGHEFSKVVNGQTLHGAISINDYNAKGFKPFRSLYQVIGDNAYLKATGFHFDAFMSSIWDAKFQILFILLWAVIGFLFGRFKLYPLVTERGYRARQYDEKNRFINALTQLLTAESMSVYTCISRTQTRAGGQFGMDLQTFVFKLRDASEQERVLIFNEFCERYRDDLIFVQYMDQIRVTLTEGRKNLATIQQLKDWHGQVKSKQSAFMKKKNDVVRQFKMYIGLTSGLILMVHFMPMTWNEYVHNFSMAWVGVIVTGIYMIITWLIVNRLTNVYFDDNVLSTVK